MSLLGYAAVFLAGFLAGRLWPRRPKRPPPAPLSPDEVRQEKQEARRIQQFLRYDGFEHAA